MRVQSRRWLSCADHGNHEGVDWNILRQFNIFDIDKGRHSMVEAANAIHLSLQSMHLHDIDVEYKYNYLTGNLGIDAKVESLHRD
eukprot:scaffold76306_cov40-Cyclotella_meneghiniana.AAC.3